MKREFTITADTRPRFIAWLSNLDLTKPQRITVEPEKKERSTTANARHRLLMGMAADHVGITNEEMHQEMLMRYFGEKQVETVPGKFVRRPIRTTTTNERGERDVLDPIKFRLFADSSESFIAESLGIWLDQQEAA